MTDDPHAGQPISWAGVPLSEARLAVILVHGRGGSAADILALAQEFGTNDVAFVAPDAAGGTWYPYSFLAPIHQNEPGISSGLRVLSGLVSHLEKQRVQSRQVGLIGFSQGACLSLEFVARHARQYAAVVGLSGGLIGPSVTPRDYTGSLEGTPVFLGCSDIDPYIPLERVRESADVFRQLGASVDDRIYPQAGHNVNHDEVKAVHALLTKIPGPR